MAKKTEAKLKEIADKYNNKIILFAPSELYFSTV